MLSNKNNNIPTKHLKAQMIDKNVKLKDTEEDSTQKLSASDINDIIKQEELLNFNPLPYIEFFGKKVDLNTLIISCISLIIWIIIWRVFNLFEIGTYSLIFFFIYIAILFFNIFNSSIETEKNLEFATYEIEKHITNVEAAMGVIVILYVFLYNIQLDNNSRIISYKLLTIVMVLCSIAIIKYALKNDTKNVRTIRIFTEKLYNQAIILFILSLFVIYLGIIKK